MGAVLQKLCGGDGPAVESHLDTASSCQSQCGEIEIISEVSRILILMRFARQNESGQSLTKEDSKDETKQVSGDFITIRNQQVHMTPKCHCPNSSPPYCNVYNGGGLGQIYIKKYTLI